jgi:LPS O-antigen subunit length determinant protein (WzzB/FepE family)
MDTSLNVPTAPPVPLDGQNQFSFERATPSDGKFPEKIITSTNSTVATASDCGAPRIHNEQQRPLVVVEDKAIKFSELTAAQLATLWSENIQTFRQMSKSRRPFSLRNGFICCCNL